MNKQMFTNRVRGIRNQLMKKRLSCFVVSNPSNVTYITGFSGRDSWVVVTKRAIYLITDSRYAEQAQKECRSCKIIQRTGPMSQAVASLKKKLKSPGTIAVEKSISLATLEQIKKKIKGRLRALGGIVEEARSIKDKSEIITLKKAIGIAARAFEQAAAAMKPGRTENELAGMLDFQIRKLGGTASFDTIVAFGANASRPHHHPGSRRLKKNDTAIIDFGVKYNNYCCDITRCLTVGKVTAFYKRVYTAVQEARAAAISLVKDGVEIKKVDAAAREVIAKHHLPIYGHGTGHGLGLDVHEEPIVTDNSKGRLKAGQIITIEPAVYIPGKLGVRIEDDILVTQTGCKVLSTNLGKGVRNAINF